MSDLIDVLRECLSKPGDDRLLDELKERVTHEDDILARLDAYDDESPGDPADGVPADWLAKVYEVLAGADGSEKDEAADWYLQAREDDHRAVGRAFGHTLMADPPLLATKLEALCAALPEADPEEVATSRHCPSLEGAGAEQYGYLATRGLTPLRIFKVTKALSSLFTRFIRYGKLSDPFSISWDDESVTVEGGNLTAGDLAAEAAAVAEIPPETAPPLVGWVLDAMMFKPFLLRGLAAVPAGPAKLRIRSFGVDVSDIGRRFTSGPDAIGGDLIKDCGEPSLVSSILQELGPHALAAHARTLAEAYERRGDAEQLGRERRNAYQIALAAFDRDQVEEGRAWLTTFNRFHLDQTTLGVSVSEVIAALESSGWFDRGNRISRLFNSIYTELSSVDAEMDRKMTFGSYESLVWNTYLELRGREDLKQQALVEVGV